MANPFRRADRHGAPSIRPTPPESAEKPMPDPMTGTRELPGETRETSRSTGRWRLQAPIRQWNHRRRSTSHQQRARRQNEYRRYRATQSSQNRWPPELLFRRFP